MSPQTAKFDFPGEEIQYILRNSYSDKAFYAVDKFESKRLKILMAKYGCRNSLHTLPGHLTANFFPFIWDRIKQCYRMDDERKVTVQLNTLEEAVIMHPLYT